MCGHRRCVLCGACYVLALMIPALLAVPLSAGGQPGHITAANAFLAPFLGPWSETLPPNAHPISAWTPHLFDKAVILSVATVVLTQYGSSPGSAGVAVVV